MIRSLLTLLLLVLLTPALHSQKNILENENLTGEIREGILAIYNYRFEQSGQMIRDLENYSPDHPAVPFLKALELYWKYFPITDDHPKAPGFIELMEQSIVSAEKMADLYEDNLEAIFFDMFSRAFLAMFWADNGSPGKVFPHLNRMYRHAMEGFELKDEFVEFYFSTGLYNYYIEAYPEKHPAYKPVAALFQDGDREAGLQQLEYCAKNAVFLKVEARFFLALLYLNYEQNLDKASELLAGLYRQFPQNPFYAGKYLEVLLFNKKYFFAPVILKRLKEWDDPYANFQYHLFNAYYLEKSEKKYEDAYREYEKALKLSEKYDDFTRSANGIAYMGLGRYYARKGNNSRANSYFRKAKNATSYEYVISDF